MTTMKPCLKNRQLCIASELLYAIILVHSHDLAYRKLAGLTIMAGGSVDRIIGVARSS